MITFSADERLALLLSVLGDEIAEGALSAMDSGRSLPLRKIYREFQADPPSADEIEFVIGDFLKFFDFAADAMGLGVEGSPGSGKPESGSNGAVKIEPEYFPQINVGQDPIQDLNQLDPYQIYKAIDSEHPKTIALVLRSIHVKQAAKVLELLASEVRNSVVKKLTVESTVPAPIVNQVLKTTVERAAAVKFRPIDVEQARVIADLMRSVSKSLRVELMSQIAETNSDLAEQIKSKLYLFDDVLRLSDRDVQKLLSQVETESLIIGLQRCDSAITEKLLNNLSKRAKETIVEEMEYKKGVSDQEIEEARAKLVQVIGKLDEAGEIKL